MTKLVSIIVLLSLLSACATVDRGTSDYFRIDTVPQGAKVTTTQFRMKSGKRHYLGCEPTPCAVKVPRRSEFVASAYIDGYEPADIYISSGLKRGGASGNMASNMGASMGTGALVGATTAAYSNMFANIFSFGTVNNPYSTSAAAGSGAAVGAGIGVGLIATDVATGALLNLYPNPVVLGLAPKDTSTVEDPLAKLYLAKLNASESVTEKCRNDSRQRTETCKTAQAELKRLKFAFKTKKAEISEAQKQARRERKPGN